MFLVTLAALLQSSAGASCAHPEIPAAVSYPTFPTLSAGAMPPNGTGSLAAHLAVVMDASGKMKSIAMVKGTGYKALDTVVESTAQSAQYTAQTKDCQVVAGPYDLMVVLQFGTGLNRYGGGFGGGSSQSTLSLAGVQTDFHPAPPTAPAGTSSGSAPSGGSNGSCTDRLATMAKMVGVSAHGVTQAMASSATGPTKVLVTVDANGLPTDEKIVQSSGVKAFDDAAVATAKASSYTVAMSKCTAVTGSYTLVLDYR